MQASSKKLLVTLLACSLVLAMASVLSADTEESVVEENARISASTAAVMAEIQAQFPFPPAFSDAWYTGTWCYITCSNGTFTTTTAWSTSNCCDKCMDFCNSGCIAEGGGPSVLCDNGE